MQSLPTPDTPDNWNAASRGYAQHVAPRMMGAYAEEFADRLDVDSSTDALEVDFVSRDLEVADFDAMWEMLTCGAPPVQMLFDRVGPQGKNKLHDTQAGIVDKRFGAGPIRLTNVATVGCGVAN
jgi:hypothetical protein